jgi:glycosyltransferase involved in cell wall biosynthesis
VQVAWPIPERLAHFRRSVRDYCRQTHPRKELVIVLDHGPAEAVAAVASFVQRLGRSDIRLVRPEGEHSLGGLRNISLDCARGEFICQWDDDDLHHPQRIERQLEALAAEDGDAVHLEEVMHFFTGSRELYCTNWRATEARVLPGTLLCRRSAPIRYPESGHASRFGEDTAVSLQLLARAGYVVLRRAPWLYVYVSHGGNLWADEHHRMLARELGLSQRLIQRREAELRDGLRPFDFGPDSVTVRGYNGAAFVLPAAREPAE